MTRKVVIGMVLCLFSSLVSLTLLAGASTGEEIYNNSCATCHGDSGLSMATPLLHGQEPGFLTKSLHDFKSGGRNDEIMQTMNFMAMQLSDEEIKLVAVYLAGQDPCSVNITIDYESPEFRETFMAGQKKYTEMSCSHCHDTYHHGAPRLIGQKEAYIKASLAHFKSGKRKDAMMNNIASNLTDEDIQQLSTYVSALRLMRNCQSHEPEQQGDGNTDGSSDETSGGN